MENNIPNKPKRNGLWKGIGFFVAINAIIITIVYSILLSRGESFNAANSFLIKEIYLNQFFGQPPIFLGFVTFVGYLVLKKTPVFALIGALKTTIGYLILLIGSSTLINMAKPIFIGIKEIGGSGVVPLDPYFGWVSANSFLETGFGVSNSYLSLVSYVFLLAFIVNIILISLKRFTNLQALMISGHIMFQQSAIITTFTYVLLFRDFSMVGNSMNFATQFALVVVSAIFLGVYWAVGSTLTIKPVKNLTKVGGFGVGHQQMLSIALAHKVGKYFGNPQDSAENMKRVPKWLKIFEDNIFSQLIILLILFGTLITFIFVVTLNSLNPMFEFKNGTYVFAKEYSSWNVLANAHPIINIFTGSLKLVGSIVVILTGVRMFVAELQQAFQGISEKIIPGAVAGVDVAATFGFSPNSITLGFIAGTVAQYIGVGVVVAISRISNSLVVVAVPLFITLFFNSGALGVFANASGGWKAAIIVPAIFGFLEIIVISFALAQFQNYFGASSGVSPISRGYIGMADWNLFYGLITFFSAYTTVLGWVIYVAVIVAALIGAQFIDTDIRRAKLLAKKQKLQGLGS